MHHAAPRRPNKPFSPATIKGSLKVLFSVNILRTRVRTAAARGVHRRIWTLIVRIGSFSLQTFNAILLSYFFDGKIIKHFTEDMKFYWFCAATKVSRPIGAICQQLFHIITILWSTLIRANDKSPTLSALFMFATRITLDNRKLFISFQSSDTSHAAVEVHPAFIYFEVTIR